MNPSERFAVLGEVERLETVRLLIDERGVTSVETLAEHVADVRGDASTERAEISLRHVHLPKLEQHGAVEVDPETDVVELTTEGEELRPLVTAAEEFAELQFDPVSAD